MDAPMADTLMTYADHIAAPPAGVERECESGARHISDLIKIFKTGAVSRSATDPGQGFRQFQGVGITGFRGEVLNLLENRLGCTVA
jgi:hypothetical protein